MTTLLCLTSITRNYDQPVLRDVALRVAPGEIAVVVGPSGSGKTTLLRIAAGLERTETGRVELRGQIVDDGAGRFVPPERRRLGMVFQEPALWSHLSARDNVALALAPGAPRNTATALLEALDIGHLRQRFPDTLSGGQRQRVSLARALATGSDLLLLDEPLSSLDAPVRDRLRTLIRDTIRTHGRAALFVSHDRMDAWQLADRVIVLEQGRIVQDDLPQHLHAAPASETVARIMGASGSVAVTGRDGASVWAGDHILRAASKLAPGENGTALAHPHAVRIAPEGFPATLVDCRFEGGWWRARWRIAEGELASLHPEPPSSSAILAVDDGHLFAFPKRPAEPQ